MDRCALFVDAGYVLGDGAMAVHGTRNRESVSWDYAAILQILGNVARDRTGLPLLRCYWYEATVEGRRRPEHETLADLPGVKLRLGRMRPGHREGVESEIHRDLTTLARNRAISDALVVSAEEDLAQVISDVQDLGIRVILAHIQVNGTWTAPAALRQECDDVVEIGEAHLRSAVELVVGAEPVTEDERQAVGAYAGRPANGHGPTGGLNHRHALPAGSHAAPPAIYTGPVIAEYQRAAQPALSQPTANSSGPAGLGIPPAAGSQGPGIPGAGSRSGPAAPSAPQPQTTQPQTAQPGQPGAAVPPGTPPASQGIPGRPGGPAQPGQPGLPNGMPGQPAAPPGIAGQPGPGVQQGLTAQPGLSSGMAGQPGPPGLPPASSGPSGSHAAGLQPGAQGQPAPRVGGQHAGPAQRETSIPGGSLPVVHGQHELAPQQSMPPGAVGMSQPYQNPVGLASQQGSPLPSGMPPSGMPPSGMPASGIGPSGVPASGMGPSGMAGQPGPQAYQAAPPGPSGVGPSGPAPAGSRPPGPLGPAQPAPAGQPGAGTAVQPGQQLRGAQPSFPPAGHLDGALSGSYVPHQGPHSGPQPTAQPAPVPAPVAVSLADAVQAAHSEGFNFGQVVARDAPALWLEAVLARKPRMPSDLEARLLQDSSLPIDSLLHDEVRHALRRGFWDALERVRH